MPSTNTAEIINIFFIKNKAKILFSRFIST